MSEPRPTVPPPWLDAAGQRHHPASTPAPKRIVSLVPSLTESLVAVGGRERLVGITAFCTRPKDLLQDPALTVVGGTKRFQREKVLALRPDLVLVNLEENELEEIEFLRQRVPCYINGVKTLEDGIATLHQLACLIGRESTASRCIDEARARLAAVEARVAERRRRKAAPLRVFYPVWREPWMSVTADTFIANHLARLGAEAVPGGPGPTRYPQLTLAQAAEARPDLVWLPSEPYPFGPQDREELRAVPGLGQARIELVNGDHLCWFGYRQLEGLDYAYRMLWRQAPEAGPLPLDWKA